jgi:hypothetical protein
MVDKSTLKRMEVSLASDTLDGCDGSVLTGRSEEKAAIFRLPVDKNGTGAADTLIAPQFRAGQAQFFSQDIQESIAILDSQGVSLSVDLQ